MVQDLSLDRFAHQLLSLSACDEHLGGRYKWLASSLISHLEVIRPLVKPLVAALRKMRVRSLSLSRESQEESPSAALQLEKYLASEVAFDALVELRITGFGFPDALRGLRLQRLAVMGDENSEVFGGMGLVLVSA